ncbi:MAG: DUF1801 domain-containing protein [Alphaproteobacteria bacterium]|nr:DUF1801 domain-containing protein [Alphaproteobacteria bacterium]
MKKAKKAVAKATAKKAKAVVKNDWRAETFARVRAIIEVAAPDATVEAKWKKATNPAGVPTWSQNGILFTGETYKDKLKFTFAHGAALDDPAGVFNASLDAGTRRAIDIHEGDKINEKALKALIRAAVAFNTAKKK